ncbi:MAG: SDR family NAD(P)-dependent oxidoreductase [Candidatus Kapaibacterium sp.]
MNTALITGASSGIGRELALVHAARGGHLVLVARRDKELMALKSAIEKSHSVRVTVIEKDLSQVNAPREIYDEVRAQGIQVDILMNNAGFGVLGDFAKADEVKTLDMIHVNITALVALTRLFLPDMIARNSGRILNVASTAAFQPGPLMAVYYATKAFVVSFSEAVRYELRGSKITVTTLCPGPTKSEFQQAAGMTNIRMMAMPGIPTSRTVADYGYDAMMRGKGVAIQGAMNRISAFSTRFAPRNLVMRFVHDLQSGR